ncbi:MAG TPA: hypothetical protein VIP11_08190 [Gemmatimonadaceae bacterium]
MASRQVGPKRAETDDAEIPAELSRREAQDRSASRTGSGRARSPVDSKHVDRPKQQNNTRGHKQKRRD